MKFKTILISASIFIFRVLDLYTTQLGIKNFQKEEQNLIVKITRMDMKTFFIIEVILAVLAVGCYLFYLKNRNLFVIKAISLKQYINLYLFNKTTSKIKDWLTYFNFKKILVLLGSCIPVYVITTSILFSLNNYWVYLYNENNKAAVKYYLLFNDYHFFYFIIFVFPVILLFFLLIQKFIKELERNKIQI